MKIWIDAETIPAQPEAATKRTIAENMKPPANMKTAETIGAWHSGTGKYAGVKAQAVEDAYLKTSLDGSKGEIVSLAWAFDDEPVQSAARDILKDEPEAPILQALFESVAAKQAQEHTAQTPFFIGHNIGAFDLKYLYQRCVILSLRPPFGFSQSGRHDQHFYDTMIAWAGYRGMISQDNLCKALGIEGKPEGIDGSKVWEVIKNGGVDRVRSYNIDDVAKVRMIYNRLEFLG